MTPKVKATNNAGLQDDHDPNDLGQKLANREDPAASTTHEDEEERAFHDREPVKKKTGEF
jgi:hypothetical protein